MARKERQSGGVWAYSKWPAFLFHIWFLIGQISLRAQQIKKAAMTRATLTCPDLLPPPPVLSCLLFIASLSHYLVSLWWPLYIADLNRNGSMRQEYPARNNISQLIKKLLFHADKMLELVTDAARKVSSEGSLFKCYSGHQITRFLVTVAKPSNLEEHSLNCSSCF